MTPRQMPIGRSVRIAAALAVGVVCLVLSRTASAHDLVDNDDLAIDINAWAQAGYFVEDPPRADDVSHGTYLGMARLAARAVWKGWGQAFVQYDAASTDAGLLDLVAEFAPTDWIAVRFGRFKVPTSRDFLVPGPATGFVNRARYLDEGFVQGRRVGGEVEGRIESDTTVTSLQVGWFDPTDDVAALFGDEDGKIFSARVRLETDLGLELHLAWADLLLADNEPVPPADDPTGTPRRPVRFDRTVDAAAVFSRDGWAARIEGAVSFDPPEGEDVPYAGYAQLLKSFALDYADLALEPGLRYDLVKLDARTLHRGTATLTLYVLGNYLNVSTNYELRVDDSDLGHAGYIQLQAGL